MGNDSLLAFFEIPKGKEPAGNRNAIGAMQHCAFVVTAERLREVATRLKSHGIDYIGPIAQLPGLLGITSTTLSRQSRNQTGGRRQNSSSAVRGNFG